MTTTKGAYRTIAELRQAHPVFFSRATMRFFDSRIESWVYDGRYFITSEQFHGSQGSAPRRYTIRVVSERDTIETLGGHALGWQAFRSREDAKAFLRAMRRVEATCPVFSPHGMALWDAIHQP